MRVILVKDFIELGKVGDERDVKDGYALNFLIPRGIAAPLNSTQGRAILARLGAKKEIANKLIEKAAVLAKKLDGQRYEIKAKVGSGGKLFGSISKADIAKVVGIEKECVKLGDPIKSAGIVTVDLELAPNVGAQVILEVVPE
jgi:large subunit ribosomal protein L9